MEKPKDDVQTAEAVFWRRLKRGEVQTHQQQALVIRPLPPPDPEHPEYLYDTFFSCLAHHVAGDSSKRIDVRDRLLCHLGAIIFDKRYIRGFDVVDTALNSREGAKILERRLASDTVAQRILGHYAVRIIISHWGAYVGCTMDAQGGAKVQNDPVRWKADPHAFARCIGKFVDDNLGDIPSAPRRGVPHHLKTQTTCVDAFLYLALDKYPDWRPIVYKAPRYGHRKPHDTVEPVEYRPDFGQIRGDGVQLYREWCNKAHPIYMFYDGTTKRYHLLRPVGIATSLVDLDQDAPVPLLTAAMRRAQRPPGALFALSKSSKDRRKTKDVGYFVPPTHAQCTGDAVHRIHTLALEPFQVSTKRFYSVIPAKRGGSAFQIDKPNRIYIYVVRPAQTVQQEWHAERVNALWQSSGSLVPLGGGLAMPPDDAIGTPHSNESHEPPKWPPQTTHVIQYRSHEGRTGIWPSFTLLKDVSEILVVVARDEREAVASLRRERPRQPLVSMEHNGVIPSPSPKSNH